MDGQPPLDSTKNALSESMPICDRTEAGRALKKKIYLLRGRGTAISVVHHCSFYDGA